MECHKGYSVALDENGKFLRVANLHYEVGQTVAEIVVYKDDPRISMRRKVMAFASMAACLLCLIIGSFHVFTLPYGNVHLQINPEVNISVNRLCYVTALKGENEDGQDLIEDYSYKGKKIEQVLYELTEKAMQDGYLAEGGIVNIEVNSKHLSWREKNLDGLADNMREHFMDSIQVNPDESDDSVPHSTETSEPQDNNRNNNVDKENSGLKDNHNTKEEKDSENKGNNSDRDRDEDKDKEDKNDDDDGQDDDDDDTDNDDDDNQKKDDNDDGQDDDDGKDNDDDDDGQDDDDDDTDDDDDDDDDDE